MLTKLKSSIYSYVVRQLMQDYSFLKYIGNTLLNDEEFVKNFYVVLQKEQKRVEFEKREAKSRELAAAIVARAKSRQDSCSHLKGGKGPHSPIPDYNIWMHTFPVAVGSTVKCLTCGKVWSGDQLKSEEVKMMLKSTTNTRTSSEVKGGKTPDRDPKGVYYSEKVWKDGPRGSWEWDGQSIMDYIVGRMKKIRMFNKMRQNEPNNLS
jgi:hypothetical protein